VTGEKTRVAEVDVDFYHVAKRSAIGFENGGNVIDGLRGLLLDGIAHKIPGGRIERSRSGHEDEISSSPSLRVSSTRGRTTLALNRIFGHVFRSYRESRSIRCNLLNGVSGEARAYGALPA